MVGPRPPAARAKAFQLKKDRQVHDKVWQIKEEYDPMRHTFHGRSGIKNQTLEIDEKVERLDIDIQFNHNHRNAELPDQFSKGRKTHQELDPFDQNYYNQNLHHFKQPQRESPFMTKNNENIENKGFRIKKGVTAHKKPEDQDQLGNQKQIITNLTTSPAAQSAKVDHHRVEQLFQPYEDTADSIIILIKELGDKMYHSKLFSTQAY